ncbi:maltase A1-like [Anticarsia gemmatalis]|uniref:maltase A1-like n=1 Tax=Anticarsia gemmatalis TaxID=129554 RepID=UPI003F769BE9
MSVYDLLISIIIQTMIIVQQKIHLKQMLIILLIMLVLVITIVIGWLIIIVMNNKEMECDERELKKMDWWENAVVYEVYLRSFKDSDGDGIGDIKGLTSKLQYFVDAGVNVIWLTPIFSSPMEDFGYDVSDFYSIHYEYGTMEDLEDLIEKAHELGVKVLLDFVCNHASIASQYFRLSEGRSPGYEDYFVWADPRSDPNNESNRLVPSNWISEFGGSIWEWSDKRQQYYLHQFSRTQADFNFRNHSVRKELQNILKFWLEKGVDGFRIDALPHFFEGTLEDEGKYPDEPLSGDVTASPFEIKYTDRRYTKDLFEVYDVVYEWREFVDQWQKDNGAETKILLAEAYTNITNTMLYYGDERNRSGVHFPFNFDFINKLSDMSSARDYVYVVNHWMSYLPYGRVANWVLGNHDNSRMATRFGTNMVDGLNALTMMLPGVPCYYQGDEIGMENGHIPWEDTKDIRALRLGNEDNYEKYTRDPARTPFHWDNSTSAGFSRNVSTWLSVSQEYRWNNLEAQVKADKSHFKVFQALTKLRKEPALSHGNYHLEAMTAHSLLLIRYLDNYDSYALVFNVGKVDDEVDLARVKLMKMPAVVYMCSVHSERRDGDIIPSGRILLKPGEALILKSLRK